MAHDLGEIKITETPWHGIPREMYLDRCFFCDGEWGECKCPELYEDQGFEFETFWIVEPNISLNQQDFVNPVLYYGEAYRQWRSEEIAIIVIPEPVKEEELC